MRVNMLFQAYITGECRFKWSIKCYAYHEQFSFFFYNEKYLCSEIPNKYLFFPWIMALHWVLKKIQIQNESKTTTFF